MSDSPASYRSGFVAIVGRPNVGKSTLLNQILKERVAIATPKPQTTRDRIAGIKQLEGAQLIFLDTPGIHEAKGPFNEFMVKEALGAIHDADVILFIPEVFPRDLKEADTFELRQADLEIIERIQEAHKPTICTINRIDLLPKESLLPVIDKLGQTKAFQEIYPVSALTGDGVDLLVDAVGALLPEGPRYYPEDELTDRPVRFLVSEMIREQVFMLTKQELPYATAVEIDEFKEADPARVEAWEENGRTGKSPITTIHATIHLERDSQKGIIIGKGGAMLKRIGTKARRNIERLLGNQVLLKLHVRVEAKWTTNPNALKRFGYHRED